MTSQSRNMIVFFSAALAVASPSRSQSTIQQKPGEYPEYLFREPFPQSVQQTSKDFSDKYLFGDWLRARSELEAHGIRPQ